MQMLAQRLFNNLVKHHERVVGTTNIDSTAATNIDSRQVNALCYVAGHVVSRLPRKILRKCEQETMRKVIKNMVKDSKDTALSYITL